MTDQTKTTGTPAQEGGDAVEQTPTAGTPATDDRDAESGEEQGTDWKAIALSNKQKMAEMERKLAELANGSPQPPVAESQQVQDKTDQIDTLRQQAQEMARRGDAAAALGLANEARLRQMEVDLILQRQLDKVPEKDQERVLKHYNANRHLLGDIKTAYRDLSSDELASENEKLRQRLAALEKGPDPEVMNAPPTHGREITARETKNRMTRAEWEAEQARLEESGDFETKYKRQRQLRKGEITIR